MLDKILRRCAYAVAALTLGPPIPYGVMHEPAFVVPGVVIGALLVLNWISARSQRYTGMRRRVPGAHRLRE